MQPEQLLPEFSQKIGEIDILSGLLRGDDPVRGYLMDAAFLLREAAIAIQELHKPASRLLQVIGRTEPKEIFSCGKAPWGGAEVIDFNAGAAGLTQAVDPSFEALLIKAFGPRGLWPLFVRLQHPDEVRLSLEFARKRGAPVRLEAIYSEIDLRLHFEPGPNETQAMDTACKAGWQLVSVRSAYPGGEEARFTRWLDLSAMTQYDRSLRRATTRLVEPLHVSYETQFLDDVLEMNHAIDEPSSAHRQLQHHHREIRP